MISNCWLPAVPGWAGSSWYFNRYMDVALYTIDGQLLQVVRNAKSMDIMNLSPGTYVLKNEDGEVKKLVVQ